jgi:hypothetical protein
MVQLYRTGIGCGRQTPLTQSRFAAPDKFGARCNSGALRRIGGTAMVRCTSLVGGDNLIVFIYHFK